MRLRHFVLCFEEVTVQFYDPYPEVNGFVDENILFHTITGHMISIIIRFYDHSSFFSLKSSVFIQKNLPQK